MIPKTPFNNWILNKIATYLTTKEGCEANGPEYTSEGARVVVQDAFGYRYEISVKTISRIDSDSDGLDKYAKSSQGNFLAISQIQKQHKNR